MLTGVREAVRALHMLKGDDEDDVDAAAGAVDAPVPSRKRSRVSRDLEIKTADMLLEHSSGLLLLLLLLLL